MQCELDNVKAMKVLFSPSGQRRYFRSPLYGRPLNQGFTVFDFLRPDIECQVVRLLSFSLKLKLV
jgi:hypothetical protein